MAEELIGIRWIEPVIKGCTDLFPLEIFATEGLKANLTHLVICPRGTPAQARFRMKVQDTTADSDYESFPDFNIAMGMDLGVLRLEFADKTRRTITHVSWKYQGGKLSPAEAKVVNPLPPRLKYSPSKGKAKTGIKKAKERPGQMRFRNQLLMAYGDRCCISACPVINALEGAHIDGFSGKSSDHPQNGLLLRHDLHALFDAGVLAVHPETRRVHFAASALAWPEYKALHETQVLREPTYGGPSYRPDQGALNRRWRAFKSRSSIK